MAGTRLRGGSRLCRRHTFGAGLNPVAPSWYYGKTRRQSPELTGEKQISALLNDNRPRMFAKEPGDPRQLLSPD
jgi:hypothetical protein